MPDQVFQLRFRNMLHQQKQFTSSTKQKETTV